MYKVYISENSLDDCRNSIELTFDSYSETANFVYTVLEHSENYVVEIIKE